MKCKVCWKKRTLFVSIHGAIADIGLPSTFAGELMVCPRCADLVNSFGDQVYRLRRLAAPMEDDAITISLVVDGKVLTTAVVKRLDEVAAAVGSGDRAAALNRVQP